VEGAFSANFALRSSAKFSRSKESLPQDLAVPLDPISVGASEGGYALLDPSAVGGHAFGCKRFDA
jgi:hypothetical protein